MLLKAQRKEWRTHGTQHASVIYFTYSCMVEIHKDGSKLALLLLQLLVGRGQALVLSLNGLIEKDLIKKNTVVPVFFSIVRHGNKSG